MSFYLGCAVWAYKGWLGEFYPPGSKAGDFLSLYCQRFTTVEGNTTFYSVPNQETISRWAAQMPPGFAFCPKLPSKLTHHGLLEPSIPEALEFLAQMQSLGANLGPIFVQLPPNYAPATLDDLIAFLTAWPRNDVPLALEVRHPDWFRPPYTEQLNTILEELGVGRVLLDTRPAYSSTANDSPPLDIRKPKLPLQPVVTASFSIVRFISHPHQEVNQPFLEEWVTLVNQWLGLGKRIYFFVHCPEEEYSPGNARHFQRLLEQDSTFVPPLPWGSIDSPPTQLSLF
ncbi:MAG: DUF72 domain-containing protein [Symploca sp. SIO1C2]|nr:DUF72 domain-containing protein [Symploca sp. SIO1C2]